MEDEIRRQAERLREQLGALEQAPPLAIDADALHAVGEAAAALRTALAALPREQRIHVTSAELGFMPGPALEAFADKHAAGFDKTLGALAQGAAAVSGSAGEAGRAQRRAFLVRGYLRGFAHQWRQAGKGEPGTDEGSSFYELAARWLRFAGVDDVTPGLVRHALSRDWRV